MRMIAKFKTIGLAVALGSFLVACDQNTGTETPIGVPEQETALVEDNEITYDDTRTWVSTNAARAEQVTEEEYRELRTEYKRREADLDQQQVNWDDETREEWERTKQEWNDFENSVQQRLGKIDDVDVDADVDVQRENN